MTVDRIITNVLRREGGYVDDQVDRGGATKFGVTAATLGAWRRLGRHATRAEVAALTEDEAREIYRQRYVVDPGFERIADGALRAQLVDDGVLSGPATAIMALQRVLGVNVDGKLGPQTLAKLEMSDKAWVRRALLKDRALRFARIVQRDPTQSRFLVGWLTRALEFL